MNAGMQWIDARDLREQFIDPLLIEVDGDRSDLASPTCEVVDVQERDGEIFTILHVPGGRLPVATRRAMGITYPTETNQ